MANEYHHNHGRTAGALVLLLGAVGVGFALAAAQWHPTRPAGAHATAAGPPVPQPVEPREEPPAPADGPRVFEGTIVRPLLSEKALALVDRSGTTRPLVEDEGSRMLFWDDRLRGRPVRLTAIPRPGDAALRVVYVQTVQDGRVYDVDYWCEVCQISMTYPGTCYCCGDETVLRERPAR